MKRTTFLAATASAAAISTIPGIAAAATASDLPIGVSRRFPDYTLQAFRAENEVYLAYSVEALVADLNDGTNVDDYEAVDPNEVVTNVPYENDEEKDEDVLARCDGRCGQFESGGHECFVVADKIREATKRIDEGRHGGPDFHPANAGMVDQLWTSYA